jgi:DNA polymerase-3 subunit chi
LRVPDEAPVPRVEFHTGAADTVHLACRWLRKAWSQDVAVLVTAPSHTLQVLDRALWTFDAQAFIPHQRVRPGQELDGTLRRTPVWLCEAEAPTPCPRVLLNLGGDLQADLGRFDRIVELVSLQTEERASARARWRAYEALGMQITHRAQTAGP